jgi:hypothetical protein
MAPKQMVDISFDGLNLSKIAAKYSSEKRKPIPFDFKAASRRILSAEKGYITEAHYIHYYPGRIFPYIPLFVLSLSDFEGLTGPVLDPFAGSGTILLESVSNPFSKRTAIGVEKNPVGRLMCKVKSKPLDGQKIEELLYAICSRYKDEKKVTGEIGEFANRSLWFSDDAFNRLSRLKNAIRTLDSEQDYKDFFWLCYSSIVRKVSKANPYIPPPVVLKPERYKESEKRYKKLKAILAETKDPDILAIFVEAVTKNKKKLAVLNNNVELKNGEVYSEVIWDDARQIKKGKLLECGRLETESAETIEQNSIGLVFTSPPYITAQKYIRTNRLELFCLGYSTSEVASLEKGSIGTERVSVSIKILPLNVCTIDEEIAEIGKHSRQRAAQVFKYFKDMLDSLEEIKRVLRKNSYAIIVIGDNRVLNKRVETYRLLADAANKIGFEEIVVLKDTIRSRSMLTKRNGTGGIIKDEYLIILKKVG